MIRDFWFHLQQEKSLEAVPCLLKKKTNWDTLNIKAFLGPIRELRSQGKLTWDSDG